MCLFGQRLSAERQAAAVSATANTLRRAQAAFPSRQAGGREYGPTLAPSRVGGKDALRRRSQAVSDIFGDLREWGRVLGEIEQLRLAGRLDDHQEGLTRILRYRYNAQLREAALRAVAEIREPSRDLLDVLLRIVSDEYCALETRLLACEAARHAIHRIHAHEPAGAGGQDAAQLADEILRVPQPPVLRKALERWRSPARPAAAPSARA